MQPADIAMGGHELDYFAHPMGEIGDDDIDADVLQGSDTLHRQHKIS
jgi:hypothetical protein